MEEDPMKTYLMPQVWRRGSPTLTFVEKEQSKYPKRKNQYRYWLGTYHDLQAKNMPDIYPSHTKPYVGRGSEYGAVNRTRIDKELYDAMVAQSKANSKRYFVPKEGFRKFNGEDVFFQKINGEWCYESPSKGWVTYKVGRE